VTEVCREFLTLLERMVTEFETANGKTVVQTTGDPWGMLEYEIKMFEATYEIFFTRSTFVALPQALKNVVEENAILHTRQLCEIFLSFPKRRPHDIRFADLLPDWRYHPRRAKISALSKKLRRRYPRRLFDQNVMHPTGVRGTEYNYEKDLFDLYFLIKAIIRELDDESKSLRGKRFKLQFVGSTYQRAIFWA
jgi:hypothetical protein